MESSNTGPTKAKVGFSTAAGGSLYSGLATTASNRNVAPFVEPLVTQATSSELAEVDAKAESSVAAEDSSKQDSKPKAWSAALGFAPVVRKKPNTKSIPKLALPAGFVIASESATQIAGPTLYQNPETKTEAGETHQRLPLQTNAQTQNRSIPKPPPLTLPEDDQEDVNGFQKTEAGKRAAAMEGKRKKNKKRRKLSPDLAKSFTSDYDPAQPNDYFAWKEYSQVRKAEEREARRREQEAERYSDAHSDSDEERDQRRSDKGGKGRFFAPPATYDENPQPVSQPPPPPVSGEQQAQTGEEAYARRLALTQVATGEDAYMKRVALSSPTPPVQTRQSPPLVSPPAPSPPVSLVPPSMPFPPFRPPELVPTQEEVELTSAGPMPTIDIGEAQARARALAEQFAKMAQQATPPPPSTVAPAAPQNVAPELGSSKKPDPHGFAAKLMAKYGWKKGQGVGFDPVQRQTGSNGGGQLGASESGMLNPLTVSQAAGSSKKGVDTAFGSGRSNIVSDLKSTKDREEKEKFGEPSRIVLLRNVVGRNDVDEELHTEIAEEAGKHGIVERCFVHTMPFNVPDEQAVRIFVIFSGHVGAWKAVKEFDNRYFGGRQVRAKFFDETFFERGAFGIDC